MRTAPLALTLALAAVLSIPAVAQNAGPPGVPDASRVMAGTYTVDSNHTQAVWSVNHLGFNLLYGIFGAPTGTLTIDPAHPDKAAVSIEFPINKVATTSAGFTAHLQTAQLLDAAQFPTASFRSTNVAVTGTTARITGDLTLHGVTRPVVLDAKFTGAGNATMTKKPTVGFSATASIDRSDFGIGYALPVVSDKVDLLITAAFERPAA